MIMELTILMPCLNEAETIVQCIQKAKNFLFNAGIKGEVLISDNGSTDGSQELSISHGARVIHTSQRGYGAALLNGIKHSNALYIIMGDADDSYDFTNLMPFITKLREGQDLVMGNRFKGGIKEGAMPFLNRYLGNPILSFIGRLFFRCKIGDFHCGLRGFNVESVRKLNLTASGMEFASEMVVKAALKGLRISEVPTTLSPDGRSRPPHLRKWRDGWRHLKLLLLFSPRWLFLYPGIFLLLVGSLLMGTIAYEPFYIGKWRLDIHSLLFASTFVIIGLQAIFFSILASIITNVSLGIPNNNKINLFLRKFTLENGIIIGSLMIIAGIITSIFALYNWAETNFGMLLPEHMMRIVIPAVTLLITGMQTVFVSFFANLIINYYNPNDI
jgi:glycosyltransferase involved in cell wall biosynthesis